MVRDGARLQRACHGLARPVPGRLVQLLWEAIHNEDSAHARRYESHRTLAINVQNPSAASFESTNLILIQLYKTFVFYSKIHWSIRAMHTKNFEPIAISEYPLRVNQVKKMFAKEIFCDRPRIE